MRIILQLIVVLCSLTAFGKERGNQPTSVIITAGQSNTDGRVQNANLPDYIRQNKYKHCQWCYGTEGKRQTDGFEIFWPKPGRWAYDAVTYYWLEQALQKDFYVVKWSLGGTAISPECASNSGKYWSANPEWLSANHSTLTGGKSLLLSFTESISACINDKLSRLPSGYRIRAFLWHQGESDWQRGEDYYKNLKELVAYVRNFLVKETGDKRYKTLSFICGTVAHDNRGYNADVESAFFRLAKEDKNFYVIDMSKAELQKDQLHFTEKSAEYLGIEMYNRLVELGIAGKKAKKVGH